VIAISVIPCLQLVCNKVLAAGAGLKQLGRFGSRLKSGHETDGVLASKEGVLPGSLEVAAPTRIPRDVDYGRPVRAVGSAFVHESARFSANLIARGSPEGAVERTRRGDGQRKVGGERQGRRILHAGDAVTSFTPPVVAARAMSLE
jgi:hypothetical protein